ncbi:SnoaL-like domain-containing protein [Actinacidiphila yanglinensis]|uniref:SnoaL-like domain-containing protein n=1 Tax=Actinacidiphila yanglinensis TaxID=310779 RepID=A0A1H6DQE8_9ACTN|nr:nuclear transport factor 2 family protein [Actinacidiphila yanglinensis]SEG87471.1 SnoaL-like domain-containing protein [Actinacidiphila yanglinensis]
MTHPVPSGPPAPPAPEGRDALAGLAALADRAEISGLLDRYLLDFDDLPAAQREDAWYGALFTPDLELEFPVGGHHGLAGLAGFQRAAKANWARTHHASTNHVMVLTGDAAELSAKLLVTHVHPPESGRADLRTGSRIAAHAVRTPAGWRLRVLAIRLVWSRGDLPPGTGRR